MDEIEIFGNIQKGQNFVERTKNTSFLFSFVISYTETSLIPKITIAGSSPELIQFTPPADAEFLYYGFCKTIDKIPMTPDGKPTPAILTKAALESASIPHIVINAGSKISPQLPYIYTGLDYGKNIAQDSAMSGEQVLHAIDFGRITGRTLSSLTDCLIIGESIPGGTTTAQAVMRAMGIDAKVSSSIPKNPVDLKKQVLEMALKRVTSTDPISVVSEVGDPMIPFVAGMLSAATQTKPVILAGGTQMAAVLAVGKSLGFNNNNIAIGTTNYIIDDKTANFLRMVESIDDVPILSINPHLDKSKYEGLQAFSKGFAKEGVGAGGSMIASILKTNGTTKILLDSIEKEYEKIST